MTWLQKKYYSMTCEQVETEVNGSSHGLTEGEARKRLKLFGPNVLEDDDISLGAIFIRQFNSPLVFILLAASAISLLLSEFVDFFVIIGLVTINALIGFWQEVKAATSLAELRKMTATKNMVVRGGKIRIIPSEEIVPGDCMVFHPGEVVTADVRLVDSSGIMANESTITGESMPIVKNHDVVLPEDSLPFEWTNMALTGSTIVRGTGRGIVVCTGRSTYLASIGAAIKEPSPITPLQAALQAFTKRYVILILGMLSFLGIVGAFQQRSPFELGYILLATLVSAVPEGLPIVVTLCMVYGAILLRRKQTLVRSLPSIETLGSATVIASDKTGTITEGKLLVQDVFHTDLPALQRIAVLCNDSRDGVGDPLDVALMEWVENGQKIREACPQKWVLPFDSNRMLMATINEVEKVKTLFVKGAYEALREKVGDKEHLKEFDEVCAKFLKHGYRVLAFAEGEAATKNPEEWTLVLKGVIGFIDPPKQGVHHAVVCAKKAGIHVIMITGDHPLTAQKIGHEVGLWKEGDQVLTGREIEQLSDEELLHKLPSTTVLARILPEHKYKVVKALQSSQEIVAVTGDGVNDIPALRAANIGVAMGSGTEAAKSVANMILVDNNFAVLVDAIRYARLTAANIRKVIYYLVSTSLQEIVLLSCSILFAYPLPLTAIQVLWINLVTDGVMDKTFAFITEEGDLMARKPVAVSKAFFDSRQVGNIFFFGATQGIFCFILYRMLLELYPHPLASTIVFTSVVVSQWANAFHAQKEEEPLSYNSKKSLTINPYIIIAFGIAISLQLSVLYLIPSLFSLVPLTFDQWVYPGLSFGFALGAVELRKWCVRLWPSRFQGRGGAHATK